MNIRPTRSNDLPALQTVLDQTELFPSEMLPDMISGFLSTNESQDIWLSCELDGEPVGFCYAMPEALTEGTWNMLAIAVLPSQQGTGIGGAIANRLEADLRSAGHRILIADTSGTEDFVQTREFYRKNGYTEAARLPDFWARGDDKVTFWKDIAALI